MGKLLIFKILAIKIFSNKNNHQVWTGKTNPYMHRDATVALYSTLFYIFTVNSQYYCYVFLGCYSYAWTMTSLSVSFTWINCQLGNNEARLQIDRSGNSTVDSCYFHLSLLFEKGRLPGIVYYSWVMGTMMAPMSWSLDRVWYEPCFYFSRLPCR